MRISKFLSLAMAAGLVLGFGAKSIWATTISRYAFGGGMGGGDSKGTLTIKADGTATFTQEATQPREQAEAVAKMWERYQSQIDPTDDDAEPETTKTKEKEEPKPLSDAELEKKLRASMEASTEVFGARDPGKLEKLEITKETVRTVTTKTFGSLEELVGQGYNVWVQTGATYENVRFEKDAVGHLKVTLKPYKMPKRYATQALSAYKAAKRKTEFHITLPGKIITSGFPESSANTTGYTLDAAKPESIEAATKFWAEPVVIVAELGGLKMDQPLESKSLQRSVMQAMRGENSASDVPITEGGEGHTAEAISVTTTTVYRFPEGEKQAEMRFGADETPGTVVQTKFFGPKGRTLQSVTEIRVLKAVDDKGREVPTAVENDGIEHSMGDAFGMSPGGKTSTSKQARCRLGLPLPDAMSIEEITLQAVVQTVGSWKEITIPLLDGKTNEVDLAEILPGAKFTIRKTNLKGNQVLLEGIAKGSADIQKLDFQLKAEGSQQNFQSMPDFNPYGQGRDKTQRKVTLRGYSMRSGGGGEIKLLIRLPTDLKRERVRYTLTGLDLF